MMIFQLILVRHVVFFSCVGKLFENQFDFLLSTDLIYSAALTQHQRIIINIPHNM